MYFLITLIFLYAPLMYGPIAPTEFNTIKNFLHTTNLDTASEEIYKKYFEYIEYIDQNGSTEQKTIVNEILDGDYEEKTVQERLAKIETSLKSDIITPPVWQGIISSFLSIDATSTADDKKTLDNFIKKYKDRITYHMKNIMQAVFYDPEVKKEIQKALQFIIVGTLVGLFPSVAIASLKILSGNLPIARASQGLIDVGILSALDSIVRLGIQNKSEYLVAPFAASMSTAVQDFIGFVGPRPQDITIFNTTITTPELAMLQAVALTLAKDALTKEKGAAAIIKKLEFKDMVIGKLDVVPTQQQIGLIGYLQDSLSIALKNKAVRDATATVLSYAVEGALIAALVNSLGFGFYQEATPIAALTTGMVRGALEGLYIYGTRQTKPAGILQRINSGVSILSIQNYLSKGITSIGSFDIVPLVTQQIIAGAMDGVVRKTGGWKNLVSTLFSQSE